MLEEGVCIKNTNLCSLIVVQFRKNNPLADTNGTLHKRTRLNLFDRFLEVHFVGIDRFVFVASIDTLGRCHTMRKTHAHGLYAEKTKEAEGKDFFHGGFRFEI